MLDPLLKKGEACAEYYMGMIYKEGIIVEQNKKNRKKGLSLIESAAKKGYPEALNFLSSNH